MRIALRRKWNMSLMRPASGGESCAAGFFVPHQNGALLYRLSSLVYFTAPLFFTTQGNITWLVAILEISTVAKAFPICVDLRDHRPPQISHEKRELTDNPIDLPGHRGDSCLCPVPISAVYSIHAGGNHLKISLRILHLIIEKGSSAVIILAT